MADVSREQELWVSPNTHQQATAEEEEEEEEEEEDSQSHYLDSFPVTEDIWQRMSHQKPKPKKNKKKQVLLEGYVVEPTSEDDLKRTKSLTDEDLDELKGCLDLGFGFSYHEIPELCNTLPALELCYSMTQKFLDDQLKSPERPSSSPWLSDTPISVCPVPVANWKISSPGDHPEDVKARLKYWAQAVACTVRLCS